jgi:alkylhydroperoxidase/carboxymuconolactone decarboxylase family protein YurZ
MPASDLRNKYGAAAFNAGKKMQAQSFEQRIAEYDSLDQHFTKSWIEYAITGLYERTVLDTRTRLLVLTGQYTMAACLPALEDTIRAAIAAKVAPREILETILHCMIYGGYTVADPAIRLFYRLAKELNLLDGLRETQLPLAGNDSKRNYEQESKTWHPADLADPRLARLKERHGWLGVGRGVALRPKHHLNVLSWMDALDSHFAGLWVKFCYQSMYTRGVVDDKTRLLCMVGDCLAVHEETQARAHMRGSLRAGATVREVLEVILMTSVNFGMPTMVHALEAYIEVLTEDGRIGELGDLPERVSTHAK